MLEAEISRLLAAALPAFDDLIACDRLSAGASRETYRLRARVEGSERLLVFRRQAGEGAPTRTEGLSVFEEAALIERVRAAGVPAPEPLRTCVANPAGVISAWVEGETLGARIARSPDFEKARGVLARRCGEILARIHAVDAASLGRDLSLEAMTPASAVRKAWSGYQALGVDHPMIDYTARWLLDHPPRERPATLVHGDFRNGNLMVRPDGEVTAVLDWELAHIGDPMRDLGWLCTRSWRFGVADRPVGGFGTYDDLFAGYESVSGMPVDRDSVRYWEVFGSFWWACASLSMAADYRSGNDAGPEKPAIGRRSSECRIDCAHMLVPGVFERLPDVSPERRSLPDAAELLSSVAAFLRDEAGPRLTDRTGFLARVSANSLDIVRREIAAGPQIETEEALRLGELLSRGGSAGRLRALLCARLREDVIGLPDEKLASYLRFRALADILIDQPAYPGAVDALAVSRLIRREPMMQE
jgi:aminoglycoside phosphotransferase (APT) family kinase protein